MKFYKLYNFSSVFLLFFCSFMTWLFIVMSSVEISFEFSIQCFYMYILSGNFLIDKFSMTFFFAVSIVSLNVLVYSIGYMENEEKDKFFVLMNLFIFFMLILCTSSNIFWVMIGWDGLGITSFCLIMYFYNKKSVNSAMVTFMCNRFGDLFMISAIMIGMINSSFVSWVEWNSLVLSSFIVISCLTKSAQIPFSSWLPLAMAAPTPVSALVHSSTLITAGVFLIIRFIPFVSDIFLNVLMVISFSTIILAGLSSLREFDLKKIIALSTLSHVSFMMVFISCKDYYPAILHLFTHAMFKSSLFMVAGILIHLKVNNQDIRYLKFYFLDNKISLSLIVSILSMMGIPFLSGFFSKEIMMMSFHEFDSKLLFSLMFFICVALTCAYSTRIVMILSFSSKSMLISNFLTVNKFMSYSIVNSSLMSIFAGGLMMYFLIDLSSISVLTSIDKINKAILLSSMLLGLFIGSFFSKFSKKFNLFDFMANNLFFSLSSVLFAQKSFFMNSCYIWNLESKGWLDMFNVYTSKSLFLSVKKYSYNYFENPYPLYFNIMKVFFSLMMVMFFMIHMYNS